MNSTKKFLLVLIIPLFFNHLNAQVPGRSDSLDIIHYDINLSIANIASHQISGFAELKTAFKVASINNIKLDLLLLEVDSVYLDNVFHSNYSYNDTLLKINLSSPANVTDTFMVKVFYHGSPVADSYWGGFYFSGNYAYNLGVGFNSIPHNFGRVWFPCIDEFTDRALYDFHITTSNTNMAVCNGSLINCITNTDNTKTWHWKLNNTIPTYLASVAVSDYVPVQIPLYHNLDTTQAYIYVNPADTTKARNSFVNLNQIFSSYINHFGNHKWERVGYVSVPFNSGAMEHATNIAYPKSAIDGTLNNQNLYAHELAHSWFGNLITCATAGDMWINEGWARFSEAVFNGDLYPNTDPNIDGYKTEIRNLQYSVLKNAHHDDNGYFALSNMPLNITYGTTTYDKGALVVHTLKNYLGNDVFYNSIKQVLNEYSYKSITTNKFCERLSFYSGVNLTDFFDAWVNQPGFLHFSIDSVVRVGSQGTSYKYYVRQKLSHANNFGNSNSVQVSFFNSQWQKYTDTISFSGQYGNKTVTLPFEPVFVAVDYDENMADAVTDYNLKIKTTGNQSCTEAKFTLNVDQLSDSALVRVEHHWVAPDNIKNPSTAIKRLSPTRYWRIDGIFPSNYHAKGLFYYNNTIDFESTLFSSSASYDSLVIAYRANTYSDWTLLPFTKTGTSSGVILVNNLYPGEYAFAIGDKNQIGIKENTKIDKNINIFPNPVSNELNIEVLSKEISVIKIIDSVGKYVKQFSVNPNDLKIKISVQSIKSGMYFIETYDVKNHLLSTSKIIIGNN